MKSIARTGLVTSALGMTLALGSIAHSQAQEDSSTAPIPITQCKEQLPENKQYTLNIDLYLNTREGESSTLDVILLDDAAPESTDIPQGTEGFINCVLRTLGFAEAQI